MVGRYQACPDEVEWEVPSGTLLTEGNSVCFREQAKRMKTVRHKHAKDASFRQLSPSFVSFACFVGPHSFALICDIRVIRGS